MKAVELNRQSEEGDVLLFSAEQKDEGKVQLRFYGVPETPPIKLNLTDAEAAEVARMLASLARE
jgi:hypothetical protein